MYRKILSGWFLFLVALCPLLVPAMEVPAFTVVIPKNGGQEFLRLSLMIAETMKKATGQVVNVTTVLQDQDVFPIRLATTEKPFPGMEVRGLDTLGEEGFLLRCDHGGFLLAAHTMKGLEYACNAFLEKVCGVRLYAPGVTVIPEGQTISTNPFQVTGKPVFAFRDLHAPATKDPGYRSWHKLDLHDEIYGAGGWVHTFGRLVPGSVYFNYHPEYFSEVGGMRIPDGQLCLSNPEVLKVLIENLKDNWSGQPDARVWSVSQNDTYKNCECDACRLLDSRYGGPSGTMIWFVNQVAAAFPGKEISTLAYQYTRQAPVNIKPAPNVTVVLCTIECDRGAPIADRNPAFVKDLSDWSKLTSNILIWDYVVQFRNFLDPFPNLSVLQPNLKLFRKYGVKQVFQQGSGGSWSDMIELKEYLIAKLLWNPDADVDAEMNDFLNGYFGKAGPVIREYIDLMHLALKDSGGRLAIYGFPYDGYKTYLTPSLLLKYDELWEKAENLVSRDKEILSRVQKARLPLVYARLDISLHNPDPSMTWFKVKNKTLAADRKMITLLDTLAARCNRFDIITLDENGTTPYDYRTSVNGWLKKLLETNIATGKTATLQQPASVKYPVGGATALTDGLFGLNDYHYNWLGFEGNDLDAVIDLGEMKPVHEIKTDFLQFNQAWIFLPTSVEYSLSKDGRTFSEPVTVTNRTVPQQTGSFVQDFGATFGGETARFIRVKAVSLKACPPWHAGHGQPCWIFCDEIVIN